MSTHFTAFVSDYAAYVSDGDSTLSYGQKIHMVSSWESKVPPPKATPPNKWFPLMRPALRAGYFLGGGLGGGTLDSHDIFRSLKLWESQIFLKKHVDVKLDSNLIFFLPFGKEHWHQIGEEKHQTDLTLRSLKQKTDCNIKINLFMTYNLGWSTILVADLQVEVCPGIPMSSEFM